MWTLLRNWWHDGEAPGAQVFRQSWSGAVSAIGATVALLMFLPVMRAPILAPVFALTWIRAVAEARRALIFADGRVLVRPAYARARPVAIRDAVSARPCSIVVPFLLMPSLRRGLLVETASRGAVRLPLDYPHRKEIEVRLRAAFAIGAPRPCEIPAKD